MLGMAAMQVLLVLLFTEPHLLVNNGRLGPMGCFVPNFFITLRYAPSPVALLDECSI